MNLNALPVNLTPRQRAVFAYIRDYISRKGISPTLREIAEGMHRAHTTIHEAVEALEEKGVVRFAPRSARGISLVGEAGKSGPPSLTPAQAKVHNYIASYVVAKGVPPTLEEIGKGIGVSRPTAFGTVGELVAKGYLSKTPRQARGITVLIAAACNFEGAA